MSLADIPTRPAPAPSAASFPNRRPVDAATLVLVDHSRRTPRVLMGRRNPNQKFMPGKFVFPGGRVDPDDRRMPVCGMLDSESERRLDARVARPSISRPRVLALAAIRETFEETGLMLGISDAGAPSCTAPGWAAFVAAGAYPDFEALTFVARAITPPRLSRRFDTRFFLADAEGIAHRVEGVAGPEAELVELDWLTFAQAKKAEVPAITLAVLQDVEARLAAGNRPWLPVPFYFMQHGRFVRQTLD